MPDPNKPYERSVWAVALTNRVPAAAMGAERVAFQTKDCLAAATDEALTRSDKLRKSNKEHHGDT